MREDQEKSQVFVPGKGTVPIPLSTLEPEQPQSTSAFYKTGDLIDGKYLVKGFLGEGGMGAVYQVHHQFLGIDLALKTFRSAKIDQEAWLRFQREAQAIGKLEHENIVRIYDFGITKEQMPFYTMELLQGEPLGDRIAGEGPLSLKEALRIFTRVASALAHAHHSGIVHRDIKPANIYVSAPNGSNQGIVKLVDFGIAKLASSKNQELTSVGLIFGSPLYMSPEQAMGGTIDHRTDIYSLGCTIVECLTEKTPFEGNTIIETLSMHQQEKPPSLIELDRGSEYPQRLEGMVRKMLAKSPDDRYQTMEEVQRELEAIPVVAPKPQSSTMEINVAPRKVTKKIVQEKKKTFPIIPIVGAIVILVAASGVIYYAVKPRKEVQLKTGEPGDGIVEKTVDAAITGKASGLSPGPFFTIKDGKRYNHFDYFIPVGTVMDLDDGRLVVAEKPAPFPLNHRLGFEYNTNSINADFDVEIKKFGDNTMYEMTFGEDLAPPARFIEGLKVLTSLKSLSFKGSKVSHSSAQKADFLVNLENLDLSDCKKLKAKDVANFISIKKVKRLGLDEMQDIEPILESIKYSGHLNTLSVNGTKLSASEIEAISKLPSLKILEAAHCDIDDAGLLQLAKSTTLQKLYLGPMDLKPSTVAALKSMKNLKFLCLARYKGQDAIQDQLTKYMADLGCTVVMEAPTPDRSGYFTKLSE